MNKIIDIFKKQESIPLDKFINIVLYDKKFGYYMKKNPFGTEGDFITSPLISNLFGEMIAVWCVAYWEYLGKPKKIIIVELGPGEGSLCNNLLKTFKKFKEEWHNIGQVPITERNNIWETYRHNVKKFYDFLHLNRELRELDFKHNYDEKIKIIKKAEALDKVENTMQASRDLNALHKLWKNELGPVSKEFREELWTRFQKASNKIHAKRQKLQKEISSIQNENSLEKEKVLQKMKESSENVPNSHNEWQNKIKIFNNLKDEFQKIRNIPLSKQSNHRNHS